VASLDLPGLVLSSAAMALLVFTIIEAPAYGWAAARSLAGFAASAVLLAAFIARERRAAEMAVMSPGGWERQALDSIQSTLGDADPELAALLATFSRLVSGEQMPLHEKVRSALRNPPRRRRPRPRRGKALSRRLGPARAAVLIWLLASVTLITVAVILSHGGGPASCPQAWGICGG
jgi:hypothetical protein